MEDLRIIGLIDVDAFECQIHQKENPEYKDSACVVADAKSGRIVSLTSEAKMLGLNRDHRVSDIEHLGLQKYVHIFWKPQKFNKPDSTKCRHASGIITDTVSKFCEKRKITVERVPHDEWFLDLSDHVNYLIEKHGTEYTSDFEDDEVYLESKRSLSENEITEKINWLATNCDYYTEEQKLVVGASVVKRLYDKIFEETEFYCSAGVSYNKLLAKQACKIRKPTPNVMTIISSFSLNRLSKYISVRDIWKLGGDLGSKVEETLPHVKTMADLKKVKKETLIQFFGEEDGYFLYDRARGICDDEVIQKTIADSVNCGKANLEITSYKGLRFHLDNLSKEMVNRLEEEGTKNQRYTNSLKIQFWYYYANDDEDSGDNSIERTFDYDGKDYRWIAQTCFGEIREWGFHPYNPNDDTVLSELKLTAKNFYPLT